MAKYFILLFVGLASCNSSKLQKDFNCNSNSFSNLKTLTDFRKNFKIKIPENWKTNYYYDNVVSSIYAADTTINLTKTILIDASFVLNPIEIDSVFIEKMKTESKNMGLQEVTSKTTTFLKQPSYYNVFEGKKGKYKYTILNIFTKDNLGFLHVKTEIYGDSLVNERICKAINLVEKIELP